MRVIDRYKQISFFFNFLIRLNFFPLWCRASSGPGHPHCRGFTITLRHTTLGRTSGRVISPMQRPLPHNTRHSQQTNIHAPGGIRTHDLSRRAAAGRSPAEIVGSNPTGGMDICLL